MENGCSKKATRQRLICIALILGICYLLFGAALLTEGSVRTQIYNALQKGFTALPVLAVVITRWLTKDKTPWRLSLKVWKNPRLWIFCAVVPGILVALSAVLYFAVFSDHYSGSFNYSGLFALAGVNAGGAMPISNPVAFGIATVLISAVFIPIQLLELGEEIGWREYLLPRQIERYGQRKGVLMNSVVWGVAHLPLIYFGFNYSMDNPGAPWSNMAMMMLVCITMGVICSYVMIVSGNVMYAAIIHGVLNVIGEVPVYLSISQESRLLGPNLTGLISMAGLIICAIVMFARLGKVENKLNIAANSSLSR